MEIKIEVSTQHIHLTQEHLDVLFGEEDRKLSPYKYISQPGQFAAEETVNIVNGENKIKNVRVVGPVRDYTQVEISTTDAFNLELSDIPPVKRSGELESSMGIKLEGPKDSIEIENGLILARRHVHVSKDTAEKNGLEDGELVDVAVESERPVIFNDVLLRVKDVFNDAMHIDSDEGNACGLPRGGTGEIIL